MAQTQDLQRLVVSLEARIDKFDKAMAKAAGISDRQTKKIESNFARAEKGIKAFGAGLLGAVSITAAINTMGRLIDQIDAVGDAAEKAQTDVVQFQRILAAAGGDVSMDALSSGFAKLNLELGKARDGSSDLAKILKANGMEVADFGGNAEKAFLAISDLMKNAADDQQRAVIGQAAFGRGYAELLPLLLKGAEQLKAQGDAAERLGLIFSKEMVGTADAFSKAWEASIAVVRASIGALVIDAVKFGEGMVAPLVEIDEWLREHTGKGLFMRPFKEIVDDLRTLSEETKKALGGATTVVPFGISGSGKVINPITGLSGTDGGRSAIEQTDKAMEELIKTMDDARTATRGFIGDLVGGLREGLSLTQALGQAFQNLADKLLDKVLDQVVDQLLGPAGTAQTGIFGQLTGTSLKDQSRLGGGGPVFSPAALFESLAPIPFTSKPIPDMGIIRGGGGSNTLAGGAVMGSVEDYVRKAFAAQGIDPNVAVKVWKQESGSGKFWQSVQRNKQGVREPSYGDFQFLKGGKGTGFGLGVGNDFMRDTGLDPADPANRFAMIDYAAQRVRQRGWGEWAGAKAQGITGFMGVGKGGGTGKADFERPIVEVKQSLEKVADTAKQTADTFKTTFTPAIASVVQTVLKAAGGAGGGIPSLLSLFQGGGMIGGGGFAPVSGGLYGGGRADGGPVSPGMAYTVGERGTETFMPTVPGVIVPHGGGRGSDAMAVSVFESPMFKVIVERIAAQGDVRVLKAARRGYPQTASRFQKLGTV